jgi:transposase
MRTATIFRQLLGVQNTVIDSIEMITEDGEDIVVATVRPVAKARLRCPVCHRRCVGYDSGSGMRRWRTMDLGPVRTYLQAQAPRVRCDEHNIVVAAVPWARPGARVTRTFEDTCAWLAANAPFTMVAQLMRISWRTVTAITTRVVGDIAGTSDQLAGLRRIGIDEIAHRKGHRYLTVVVDHDTGRLVWAAPGRNSETVGKFFDALGPKRSAQLTHVSADGAQWIHTVVAERAPQAIRSMDPFHVIAWVTKALDEVRRAVHNDLRRNGKKTQAAALKGSRWALLKNPADLTGTQRTTLADIEATNADLYRAYLLKEQLRHVFAATDPADGVALLTGWIAWARDSGLAAFTAVAATVQRYEQLIINAIEHGITNARVEATNTHLRVLTRRSYGFHTPESMIAMAMLTRGGLCPQLPGRTTTP